MPLAAFEPPESSETLNVKCRVEPTPACQGVTSSRPRTGTESRGCSPFKTTFKPACPPPSLPSTCCQRHSSTPTLIHSRPSQSRLPPLAQNSVGAVAQIWIGANKLDQIARQGHRHSCSCSSGKVKNLTEIAALEGVDASYVSRMVNLTTLAPDIGEAILEDALPDHLTPFDLAVDPPALWAEQRVLLGS